jgi:hypothetical protein
MDQITVTGETVTLVHFTHQVGAEWRIACMPGMVEFHQTKFHPNYMRTNDARAVTCPACKQLTKGSTGGK